MPSPKDLKRELRRDALARRDALDASWRLEQSHAMASMADSIAPDAGTVVSGFWPMRSEVDVRPLMAALGENGARVCLPAILDKATIEFREFVDEVALIDMGFGTLGPAEDAETLDPSILLVPLAAFDHRGHRIGYGAGYYDRAIARLVAKGHSPRLIGIAFDCQQVPLVPDEPHDVIIPEILTESGLRRFLAPL